MDSDGALEGEIAKCWRPQEIVECAKVANRETQKLGLKMVPKHHCLVHWALQCRVRGNPDNWSTYEDEHTNGVVARIGARAHAMVWTRRAHAEFRASTGGLAPFSAKRTKY